MALNDCYKFTLYAQLGDQTAVLRRYVRASGPDVGTGATQAQMVLKYETDVGGLLKNCLVDNAEFRGCTLQKIYPLPTTRESVSIVMRGAGGHVGVPLPGQVAGIITLRTFFGGKRYRGRVYVPFPSAAAQNADGTPSTAYLAILDGFGAALIAPFTAGSGGNTTPMEPVLTRVNYVNKQVNSVEMASYEGFLSRGRWGTQRRRGMYGSPNPLPL